MNLREFEGLPDGLIATPATALHDVLGGPTLIHLSGRRPEPLFVSVLLHGDEPVGWEAIVRMLTTQPALPRALSILIGNTLAAARGVRRLDTQPDYNRVWPGTEAEDSQEARLMRAVVDALHKRGVFAAIDFHNNSGRNPHYACVSATDPPTLHLAALFARTAVYFTRPKGVQTAAFAPLCPAVTAECGRPGEAHGIAHAEEFLTACLHLARHPEHPIAPGDLDLHHTVATLRIPAGIDFGFGFGAQARELTLAEDLDTLNFRLLPPGTPLARIHAPHARIEVIDERGNDVSAHWIQAVDGHLALRRPATPAMLTCDAEHIRQDCLGYLMERI